MNKTRIEERSVRGQKIRTETGAFDRETKVGGKGFNAPMTMMTKGGMSDISHSIVGNKVKRPGGSND